MHGAKYTTRRGQCLVVGPGHHAAPFQAGSDQNCRPIVGRTRTRSSRDGVDLAQCRLSNCVAPIPSVFPVLLPASGARLRSYRRCTDSPWAVRLANTQQAEDNR